MAKEREGEKEKDRRDRRYRNYDCARKRTLYDNHNKNQLAYRHTNGHSRHYSSCIRLVRIYRAVHLDRPDSRHADHTL